mgnify:CR=1 FL=1
MCQVCLDQGEFYDRDLPGTEAKPEIDKNSAGKGVATEGVLQHTTTAILTIVAGRVLNTSSYFLGKLDY